MTANGNGATVGIGPVPMSLGVGQVMGPAGHQVVILVIHTPLGPLHFILEPDVAIAVGQNLRQTGKASKSGLILPTAEGGDS